MRKPGPLSYSIPEQPATVHELLLQKSDGTFQLIIWGERVAGSDEVAVRLGESAGVKIYDPTAGIDPIQTLTGVDSLKLTVSDHPFVLEITPR